MDWSGFDWTGLSWVRLNRNGLDWDLLDWIRAVRIEVDWIGPGWARLGWTRAFPGWWLGCLVCQYRWLGGVGRSGQLVRRLVGW